ncbi:MAG: CHAT domain-containing protein, partial [Acidimicrobiia bacterium]
HMLDRELIAFVNFRNRMTTVRLPTELGEVVRLVRRLAAQWDRFRAGPQLVERHLDRLERSAQRVLADLHRRLMAPLLPLLDESADPIPLVVVPHGPLHQVPFHALFDGSRYLLERFEISYAPSATVWMLCEGRSPGPAEGTLVIGVADDRIPGAVREAQAVAAHLGAATVLTGGEATLAMLRLLAPRSRALHLACHGLFRAENPMFSALRLGDRWVTASEVTGLGLPGSLVTLSACESGRSRVVGGDEILGLTRAFLAAGAATLVVSLWLVQDEATVELMEAWARRVAARERPVAALRAAQLEAKERHSHPYFWAPFVLIGGRSGVGEDAAADPGRPAR